MKLPINKIICGDCLKVMKDWPDNCVDNCVDLILTDPPYLKYEQYEWDYVDLKEIISSNIRALVFWKGNGFPIEYTAKHIWCKANRSVGLIGEQYEEIYDVNGISYGLVLRRAVIDSKMNAQINSDIFTTHPTQKPIHLILDLLKLFSKYNDLILDPFCGSGTTCVAAKMLGRRYIGIDISERYCEIARKRLKGVRPNIFEKPKKKKRIEIASFGLVKKKR